jgi:hypothetical protein
MSKDDELIIKEMARLICATQAEKQDNDDWRHFFSGDWDNTVWMRLVIHGIRAGMNFERVIE